MVPYCHIILYVLYKTESDVAVTPQRKPNIANKQNTLSQSKSRPALQCIDQNVQATESNANIPIKTPQKPIILTESTPAADYEHDDEADGEFFDAVEIPPDLCRKPAQRSPVRDPCKTPSKTPSFFKKILSWGSSNKYPPNTPVERSVVDVTADRITGRCVGENARPDYLLSPPRDAVVCEGGGAAEEEEIVSQVNRELLWQEETPVEAADDVAVQGEDGAAITDTQEAAPEAVAEAARDAVVDFPLKPTEVEPAVEEKVIEAVELALEDPEESPAPVAGSEARPSRENRRGSGVGLSLATSMSHAESLLLGSKTRLSGELALLQRYGTESEHTPIYSQAEMDSALENLRFELSKNQPVAAPQVPAEDAPSFEEQQPSKELLQVLQTELEMQKMQSTALYHQIKVAIL